MGEWREYKLGNIASFRYGKMTEVKMAGKYPVHSGYRIVGYTDEINCQKGKTIIVARDVGGTGDVKVLPFDCWITNLSIIVDDKYFYYQHLINNMAELDSGSAQSQITIQDLNYYKIALPPLPEQIQIACILGSLDDKIDLLHRQNKTLEQLAETLFRQWFVEEAEEGWEVGKLGDVISIYDSKRIPVSSMERAKMKTGELYPYYGAATIMDYVNQYIFDGEYILMGEDGTVQTENGFPILQMPTGKFWVNNHTHIFHANQPFSNYFIYIFLKRTNISGIVTGAVQPKINQEALKRIDFVIPPKEKIKEFAETGEQFWQKIKSNTTQIRTLTKLRDTLLPKLMSGEVIV